MQNFFRVLLFVIFFSVGAGALVGAMLCDELVRHYKNKQVLNVAEENLQKLKSLNADYDTLLVQLEKDPNALKRIANVTLGKESNEPNTIYPKATASQLAAARKVLTEDPNSKSAGTEIPMWLKRCSKLPQRITLFSAGAFLIFISFACFGYRKQREENP